MFHGFHPSVYQTKWKRFHFYTLITMKQNHVENFLKKKNLLCSRRNKIRKTIFIMLIFYSNKNSMVNYTHSPGIHVYMLPTYGLREGAGVRTPLENVLLLRVKQLPEFDPFFWNCACCQFTLKLPKRRFYKHIYLIWPLQLLWYCKMTMEYCWGFLS